LDKQIISQISNNSFNTINDNNEISASNVQLVSSGRTGFFLNRYLDNDSINVHIQNVLNSQKKIDLKKLVNYRLEMLRIDTPNQTKFDELSDCIFKYLKKQKWESNFEDKMKELFEYLDEDTKIYERYVISIHLLEMRKELLDFWENNLKKKDFLEKFEEIFNILEFKYTLLLIIRIYNFISGVSIILENINENQFKLVFFTDEINYVKIAQSVGYPLQLKPYALKYMMLEEKCMLNEEDLKNALSTNYNINNNTNINIQSGYLGSNIILEEKSLLIQNDIDLGNLNKKNKLDMQNYEKKLATLDQNEKQIIFKQKIYEMKTEYHKINFFESDCLNHLHFSPYRPCNMNKYEKFRTYNKLDLFEENDFDEDFSNESLSRKIEKKTIKEVDIKKSSIVKHSEIINLLKPNEQKTTEEKVLIQKIKNFFSDIKKPSMNKKLSIFRSIDKLRLLSSSFDQIFIIHQLEKENILNVCLYNRNIESKIYQDKKCNLLCDSLNFIFSVPKIKFLNHIRNEFGEEWSFYFLWLKELILYLTLPALLGIIFHIVILYGLKIYKIDHDNVFLFLFFKIRVNLIDMLRFTCTLLISLWCYAFIQNWKSKEEFYSYLWGCSHSNELEPYQESYIYDEKITFIFDWKIKIQKKVINRIKRLVSFLISVILVIIVIFVNVQINHMKDYYSDNYSTSKLIKIIPDVINAVFIKTMSFLYRLLAHYLSYWENHEKNSQRVANMSFKIFIFEFVNNFFIYYYIAFYKFYNKSCLKSNSCTSEIETLSNSSLLIFFCINSIEIGVPFLKFYRELRNFKKKAELEQNNKSPSEINEHAIINSDEFKIELETLDNLTEDYIEVIIYLGYTMIVSSAAPLTPFFVFCLILSERAVDAFKLYYLVRCNSINSSDGILIYNYMLKIVLIIGSLTNLMMTTFSRKYEYVDNIDQTVISFEFLLKVLIFLFFENLIFLLGNFIKFKNYPECKNLN